MPLSHFVPAYPSPSPCPQVHSLHLLRLVFIINNRKAIKPATKPSGVREGSLAVTWLRNKAKPFSVCTSPRWACSIPVTLVGAPLGFSKNKSVTRGIQRAGQNPPASGQSHRVNPQRRSKSGGQWEVSWRAQPFSHCGQRSRGSPPKPTTGPLSPSVWMTITAQDTDSWEEPSESTSWSKRLLLPFL